MHNLNPCHKKNSFAASGLFRCTISTLFDPGHVVLTNEKCLDSCKHTYSNGIVGVPGLVDIRKLRFEVFDKQENAYTVGDRM